jgi:hypothetical protein
MRQLSLVSTVLVAILANWVAASAGTLGDPQVGFSAERVLVFNGQSYVGRMWNMPGEQRHEQPLPMAKPVFILRADSAVGDIVLPNLRTTVEFALPRVLGALGKPELLGSPVGDEAVNGIATTKYAVDKAIPEGRLSGAVWLSRDGIPMRCDGRFSARDGRVSTVHWELRRVKIGRQNPALFEIPPDYTKLPPDAAAILMGLRPAPHAKH